MEATTKNETEFKPIFLFREDEKIKRVEQQIKRGADLLNDFIKETENSLKLELTDSEKIEIKNNGLIAIQNRLKESFLFKQASLEFNLQALGIDIKPLTDFYTKNQTEWTSFNYELLNGVFKNLEFDRYTQIQALSHYTKNQEQNNLLGIAKELSNTFEYLKDKKLVNPHASSEIFHITNLLCAKYIDGEIKIIPNVEFIRQFKG